MAKQLRPPTYCSCRGPDFSSQHHVGQLTTAKEFWHLWPPWAHTPFFFSLFKMKTKCSTLVAWVCDNLFVGTKKQSFGKSGVWSTWTTLLPVDSHYKLMQFSYVCNKLTSSVGLWKYHSVSLILYGWLCMNLWKSYMSERDLMVSRKENCVVVVVWESVACLGSHMD